jgi:AraC family transcriptional regulator
MTIPGEIVINSSADLWDGIIVQEQILSPNVELIQKFVNHLRIVVNTGYPITVEWKEGRSWQNKLYAIGYAGMIPHNYANNTRWDKESRAMVILLENDFIEKKLELNHFELIPQRGIYDIEINNISNEFKRQLANLPMAGKIYGDSLVISLAIHIATKYSAGIKKHFAPKGKLSSQQLKNIVDYIHSFINHNLGLNDLAKQIHVSPFHFARMFRRTMGIAPHQYILQLRMEQAKLLLKNTKKSVTDIAYELGFTDLAHFTTTFKKATGSPAAEFRKTN